MEHENSNKYIEKIDWRKAIVKGSAFFITALVGGAAAALGSRMTNNLANRLSNDEVESYNSTNAFGVKAI